MREDPPDRDELFTELFDCLAHSARRDLLLQLFRSDPPLDLSEATASAMFHHLHLPKLADAGFVDWHRERGVIDHGPRFEEITPVLEALEDCQHNPRQPP